MSWIDKRKEFQSRLDTLNQQNVQNLVTELDKATKEFIAKGGISQDSNSNASYNRITQLSTQINTIKSSYSTLNDDIMKYISSQSTDADLAGLLAQNGELQKHIKQFEKLQDELKVDVESAVARDELLRSRNEDISRHELFILDRPVRKGLIPYLWALSVLFVGIGLIIFRKTIPIPSMNSGVIGVTPGLLFTIGEFFKDRRIWMSLFGASLIVIIFLALKIAGVFGK